MKKTTFKAILAVALAVIMTIPCFSAFAANNTLVWDFYGYEDVYEYAGEMTVGTTAIPNDAPDYIWYSFDVPADGYYYIHYNYSNLDAWFGIPEEFEGSSAYNEKDFIYHAPDDGDGAIYYLEAGKTLVGFDLYYYEDATFETEYLGSDITEIKPQYDLIYDYDVYSDEYMGENEFRIESKIDLTFSEGETVTLYYLCGTTENAVVAGENTFDTELLGKEFEFTANVYYITDYVESVEISNVEEYLNVYSYYNGVEYNYPWNESIKITFTDGKTYTVYSYDSDTITLPNGREVGYGYDFSYTDAGNYYLDVYVGGTCFESYECEVKSASAEENVDKMTQTSQSHISDATYYLRRAFEVAFEDGIIGFFSYGAAEAMVRIEWAFSSFAAALDEVTYLILYLLS